MYVYCSRYLVVAIYKQALYPHQGRALFFLPVPRCLPTCIACYPTRTNSTREESVSGRIRGMKQLFFVRWFCNWRKRRMVNSAWELRRYPPCVFCQRPIAEQSNFCNWCGAAQTVDRHTTGSMLAESVSIADVAITPSPVVVPVKKYDITNELPGYYRPGDGISHWRMKAFRRMIFDEGEEKK